MNLKKLKSLRNKKTRGIALLFALGILSTVLVVAMLFASKARVEAKLTAASVDNTAARLLVKSLIPRVVLTMNESGNAQSMMLFSTSYDESSISGASAHVPLDYDWIWKLETPGYFEFEPYNSTNDKSTGSITCSPQGFVCQGGVPDYDVKYLPTWQYIRGLDDNGNLDRVIARFAFITIPQVAQLNPNAIGDHSYCKHIKGLTYTQDTEGVKCNFCTNRLGASAAELFYDATLFTSNADFDASGFPMHYVPSAGTIVSTLRDKFYERKKENWFDLDSFIAYFFSTEFKDPLNPTAKELSTYYDQQTGIRNAFDVTTTLDNEAFWVDENKDGKVDKSELWHRFNLRRTDWANIGVASGEGGTAGKKIDNSNATVFLLAPPKQVTFDTDGNIVKPATVKDNWNNDNYDTGGIAWLNSWSDPGDWNDAVATKKQIAANLINFCSPPTRPVISDVEPKNWMNTAPSYTGLKRTLYINEVFYNLELKAECGIDKYTDTSGDTYYSIDIAYAPGLTFIVEAVDMYYDTLGMKLSGYSGSDNDITSGLSKKVPDFSAYQPEIIGTVSFEYNYPTGPATEAKWKTSPEINLKDLGTFKMFYTSSFTSTATRNKSYKQPESGFYGFVWDDELIRIKVASFKISEADFNNDFNKKYAPRIRNIKVKIDRILLKRKAVDSSDTTMPAATHLVGGYEYVDCSCLDSEYKYANYKDTDSIYQASQEKVADSFENSISLDASDGINLYNKQQGTSVIRTIQGHFEVADPRQNLKKIDWDLNGNANAHYNPGNKFRNGDRKYVPYRSDTSSAEDKAQVWTRVTSLPALRTMDSTSLVGDQTGNNFGYASTENFYSKGQFGFPK